MPARLPFWPPSRSSSGRCSSAWSTPGSNDGNYSHGFLIIPIALYFVWERREKLAAAPVAAERGSASSCSPAASLVLLAGLWGSELFLSRISLLPVIAGIVLFVLGWQHLRILAFPIAFLLLMIPIPAIIFNQIAFPLQLLASRVGEWAISAVGIPVLREGNVLMLAHTTLEVAEACSGIRSLVSLITLGIVYGYFTDSRAWVRALIVALGDSRRDHRQRRARRRHRHGRALDRPGGRRGLLSRVLRLDRVPLRVRDDPDHPARSS